MGPEMYVEPCDKAILRFYDVHKKKPYCDTLFQKMRSEPGKLVLQQLKETIVHNDRLAKVRGTNVDALLREVQGKQICEEDKVALVQDCSTPCRMKTLGEASGLKAKILSDSSQSQTERPGSPFKERHG